MIIKRLNTTKTQIKNIKKIHKTTAVPSYQIHFQEIERNIFVCLVTVNSC